jgi:hypothetical protein
MVSNDLGKSTDVMLGCDDAVEVWHRDIRCKRQTLGLKLVVDQRIQRTRIETKNVVAVAPVQTKHTFIAQTAIAIEH